MQLEDYFDFLSPNDIRIKGHRIGIEFVLDEHLTRSLTLEQLAERFDTLTRVELLATLLYYEANKERVTRYFEEWKDYCRRSREEAYKKDPVFYEKFRRLLVEKMKELQEPADDRGIPA